MSAQKLIDDDSLDGVLDALGDAPVVAIDTEFVRESTYYPRLCLVQIATDDIAVCIDFLALRDPERLFERLTEPGRAWLLHSATQDLEVLWLHTKRRPEALIDTQIAAALLGHATQIGLQELLSETLGVDIGKGLTRTDWSRRPLPRGALEYAVDDVRHLLPLWRALEARLTERDRLEWLEEDCRRLLENSESAGIHGVWARLKGVHALGAGVQRSALSLLRWRERVAQKLDRPRRWIMSDDLLLRVAQLAPRTADELGTVPDMPKKLAARFGRDIVAALKARDDPEIAAELERIAKTDRPERDAVKALQQQVRQRAAELGIQADVLASRRDLVAWLTGNAPEHLRSGWRAAQVPALAGAAADNGDDAA